MPLAVAVPAMVSSARRALGGGGAGAGETGRGSQGR